MSDSILYKVRSGKPIKFWYFIRKYPGTGQLLHPAGQDQTDPVGEQAGSSPKLAALYGTYRPIPE